MLSPCHAVSMLSLIISCPYAVLILSPCCLHAVASVCLHSTLHSNDGALACVGSPRSCMPLGREWLSLACAVAQPSMGGPPCCCSSGHHGCTKMPHVYYGARALGLQWVRVRMGLGTPMTTSHYNHHCYQHHIGGIRFSTCLLEALIFI